MLRRALNLFNSIIYPIKSFYITKNFELNTLYNDKSMLPISLSQIKSFNIKNQFKISIWAIFRSFQLKNKKKYSSVYFDKDTEITKTKIYLPNNIETVKTIKEDTLIIINKVEYQIF